MAHFAQIDKNNIVVQVIVVEQQDIDSGVYGDPSSWIKTSYNTQGGEHPLGKPLRKNFAGIGYKYDKILDAFIPPRPHNSWILNQDSCCWEPPVEMPMDGKMYNWDEQTTNWKEVEYVIN